MKEVLQDSVYFGVLISLSSYIIGLWIRRKTKLSYMNPLLIAIIITICFLLISGVSYKSYSSTSSWISYLLTPATICLAVPLYQQIELLKKNSKAILFGILSGVLSSLVSILLLALLFSFDHNTYVTFLPKSITTAIGMGISEDFTRKMQSSGMFVKTRCSHPSMIIVAPSDTLKNLRTSLAYVIIHIFLDISEIQLLNCIFTDIKLLTK
jgi:putative effector of murein hydrolase